MPSTVKICAITVVCFCINLAKAEDNVKKSIATAHRDFAARMTHERASVLSQLQALKKAIQSEGDLEKFRKIESDIAVIQATGKLPASLETQASVEAIKTASEQLDLAYKKAVKDYINSDDLAKADAVEAERKVVERNCRLAISEQKLTLVDLTLKVTRFFGSTHFEGREYYFFRKDMHWKDAEAFCKEHGGRLAFPRSNTATEFLCQMGIEKNALGLWLGGMYNKEANAFQWNDGTEVPDAYWLDSPPSASTAESYPFVVLHCRSGKWSESVNDDPSDGIYFICEYDL